MNSPDMTPELTLDASALSPNATIVANAQTQPALSSLVAAVQRAGLVDALNGAGPFTVFAPVNSAFDRISAGDLGPDELADILKYHVVPGDVASSSLVDGMIVETLNGENLTVTFQQNGDTGVKVDEAMVIYPDIMASNGRIHLINAVLTPLADGVSSVE